MVETLDPEAKELVGIAAAIAGHCRPCFDYLYKETLALGIPLATIQVTVEIAQTIRSAGNQRMDECVARRVAHGPGRKLEYPDTKKETSDDNQ